MRSWGKTLRDLAMALLNATLILLIVSLVLGLMVLQQVNRVSDRVAELASVPEQIATAIEDDDLLGEIDRLQTNLATINDALESDDSLLPPDEAQAIRQQLAMLNTTLASGADQCAADLQQLIEIAAQDYAKNAVTRLAPLLPDAQN
ncbi:MAG: hypothetical protein AAFR71_10590 [Pseudomonadota bacterium]